MATPDPTNARLRDFDIPVIMPRIDLIDLPIFEDAVFTGDIDLAPVWPKGACAPHPRGRW